MAIRGRKPKPAHLRLITGGKRNPQTDAPAGLGPAVKPKGLTTAAAKLWDERIARCHWLMWADSDKAAAWCFLQAEFYAGKGAMLSARIAQLRALGSELGLDPASRARLGVTTRHPELDPLAAFMEPPK